MEQKMPKTEREVIKPDTLQVKSVETPQQIAQKQAQEALIKKKEEQARTTRKKAQFLGIFEKMMGIITIACEDVGISRPTYYDWLSKDPEFKKQVMEILDRQRGQVEDRLLKAVLKDSVPAITFYLKNKHPDYAEKLQIAPIGARTLEDLIDEDDKKINENEQGTDTKLTNDKGQEGQPPKIQS